MAETWCGLETVWGGLLMCDRYQRAFVDFFEDQLMAKKYDIKDLLEEFLLGGKQPLINGLVDGRKYTL